MFGRPRHLVEALKNASGVRPGYQLQLLQCSRYFESNKVYHMGIFKEKKTVVYS